MEWIQIQLKYALSVKKRIRNAFVQVSFVSYLLVTYMIAEFQQDRLNQMLNSFLQFSLTRNTHRLENKIEMVLTR
jgi:hypothetical protein